MGLDKNHAIKEQAILNKMARQAAHKAAKDPEAAKKVIKAAAKGVGAAGAGLVLANQKAEENAKDKWARGMMDDRGISKATQDKMLSIPEYRAQVHEFVEVDADRKRRHPRSDVQFGVAVMDNMPVGASDHGKGKLDKLIRIASDIETVVDAAEEITSVEADNKMKAAAFKKIDENGGLEPMMRGWKEKYQAGGYRGAVSNFAGRVASAIKERITRTPEKDPASKGTGGWAYKDESSGSSPAKPQKSPPPSADPPPKQQKSRSKSKTPPAPPSPDPRNEPF